MALYVDEDDFWKCLRHPSRRRRTGICHLCLRERLALLCPDCANERPCNCYAASSSSSAGSSFSSYSRFSAAASVEGIGALGRVSSLIESEPAFRRSRSLAVPFLRSKPAVGTECSLGKDSNKSSPSLSFWSLFKNGGGDKSKRIEVERNGAVADIENVRKKKTDEEERKRMRTTMMRKSRSVTVSSDSCIADVRSTKSKGWHFPSPIKIFRQTISRGMVQERSPLYRG